EATALRRLGVSPHAPYTVSASLYRRVADYARAEGLPLAVHIAESEDEVRFVRDGEGDFARRLRERGIAVEARHDGPVAYLDSLGVLGPRTLAIHAIHAGADGAARLARAGAA